MLLNYRNLDQATKQTRSEKHYKERIITIVFAIFQSYFVISTYIHNNFIKDSNIILLMLILVGDNVIGLVSRSKYYIRYLWSNANCINKFNQIII